MVCCPRLGTLSWVSLRPILSQHLCERFKDENIFLEAVDTLLGITGTSTESNCKRAKYQADGFFIEDGKLWRLGGFSPARAVPR